jgi:hypothetical protein
LATAQLKRKKLLQQYMAIYNLCCAKIKEANSFAITDIIFEVVNFIPECQEYKPKKCLKFIKKRLNEQLIDTYIISDTKIFITWAKLEIKFNDLQG